LKILTPELGLITCSAQGAKRRNSPLKIATNNFVFAEYELFYYRDRYRLQSADVIDSYKPLMEDINRLTCTAHLAELVLDVLRHQAKASNAYSFWAYASYKIAKDPDPVLMTYLGQLKFLAEQGFSPWINDCLICHDSFGKKGGRFYFSEGGAICEKTSCRKSVPSSLIMDLQEKTLITLSYLLTLPHEKCFNIDIAKSIRQELMNFSEKYLNFVMEKDYQKISLIKSLEKFEKGIYE
ncbi:MAG TPA: DNA repair protein RecO, partial [Candidatus Eisenbacteria bacterium]|nr:DNA repair protein RecO [Candidatus Eisenbacteria bacterium]